MDTAADSATSVYQFTLDTRLVHWVGNTLTTTIHLILLGVVAFAINDNGHLFSLRFDEGGAAGRNRTGTS